MVHGNAFQVVEFLCFQLVARPLQWRLAQHQLLATEQYGRFALSLLQTWLVCCDLRPAAFLTSVMGIKNSSVMSLRCRHASSSAA